ncbi:hypothetical protein V6615_07445 [Oscillospiraceae bacterium PP1C4]
MSLSVVSFAAPAEPAKIVVDLTGVTLSAADAGVTLTIATPPVSIKGVAITATSPTASDIATSFVGESDANWKVTSTSTTSITLTEKTATSTTTSNVAYTLAATTATVNGYVAQEASVTAAKAAGGEDAFKAAGAAGIVSATGYVESKDDMSGADTVKPGKTIYFPVQPAYANTDNFEIKAKKGDNAKNIASVTVVEKDLDKAAMPPVNSSASPFDGSARELYVAVKLNDNMTDAEYKITFDFTIKTTETQGVFTKGDKATFEDVAKLWVTNQLDKSSDVTWDAGTGGFIAKPQSNEENTVEWENENRTIAKMVFNADSDVNKYFPKLSTKWDADIAAKFEGDAFVLNFVGTPTISSTSRPVLTIFNPFINDDDEYTVDVEELFVYEVIDGELVDSTAKFTATTNDDGDQVLTTKTRTLGHYIITDAVVVEAAAEVVEEVPATTDAVKPVPNTGR